MRSLFRPGDARFAHPSPGSASGVEQRCLAFPNASLQFLGGVWSRTRTYLKYWSSTELSLLKLLAGFECELLGPLMSREVARLA